MNIKNYLRLMFFEMWLAVNINGSDIFILTSTRLLVGPTALKKDCNNAEKFIVDISRSKCFSENIYNGFTSSFWNSSLTLFCDSVEEKAYDEIRVILRCVCKDAKIVELCSDIIYPVNGINKTTNLCDDNVGIQYSYFDGCITDESSHISRCRGGIGQEYMCKESLFSCCSISEKKSHCTIPLNGESKLNELPKESFPFNEVDITDETISTSTEIFSFTEISFSSKLQFIVIVVLATMLALAICFIIFMLVILRINGIPFASIFNGHVSVQKKQTVEEGDYDKPWDCKLSNANMEKIKYKFENRSGHINNVELNINTATIQNVEEEYDYVDSEPTK